MTKKKTIHKTMRLHNSLYTIQSKQSQDDAAQYVLILNAEHEIYKAHFPGRPITPGVCLLQIAKELLEDHSGASLEIQQIKRNTLYMVGD